MQRRSRKISTKQARNSRTLGTNRHSLELSTRWRARAPLYFAIACLMTVAIAPVRLFLAISSARLAIAPPETRVPPDKRISGPGPLSSAHESPFATINEENSFGEAGDRSKIGDNVIPRVFIGIKTGGGLGGHRFAQVRRTWLQDALDETTRGTVDIKFFTIEADSGRRLLGENDAALFGSTFVPTNCTLKKDLLCGTSALFQYYLERHGNGTYFCSFDDDQYLIVRNLLRVLDEYDSKEPWRGKNICVGRKPRIGNGVPLKPIPKKVVWLTGGAGYCLSRDLVERGRHLFTNLGTVWHATGRRGYTDDCAVGYVVTQKLDTDLIEDKRFHSHLEFRLRDELPLEEISQQVSFGFNTKLRDHKNPTQRGREKKAFPNVQMRFSSEEDPMLFRSLRCFLTKEETGKNAPECGSDDAHNISLA